MVFFRRDRFPASTYNKTKMKKYGHFKILHKISNNAYVIDLPATFNISNIFNVQDISPFYGDDDFSFFEGQPGDLFFSRRA